MLKRTKKSRKDETRDSFNANALPISLALSTLSARGNFAYRRSGLPGRPGAIARIRPSVIFSCQRIHVTVGGCAAFYSAVLSCEPESTVTVSPANMPTCIRISPSLHLFTKENWNQPQFFRVAAIGGTYDDNSKDDRKLQIVEHHSSSMDTRYHGNRVLYVPPTILIHISGREGSCVFTTGLLLGTSRPSRRTDTRNEHQLVEIELEPALQPPGELIAKSAMVSQAHSAAAAAAVAAIEAANSATSAAISRRVSRRNIFATPSTDFDPLYSTSKDVNALVKVSCRGNQTVLLHKNGRILALGKMDVGFSTAKCARTEPDPASELAFNNMLVDVDCGDNHIVVATEYGNLLSWGEGKDGRLGHGAHVSSSTPLLISSLQHKRIIQVACGARHTFALAEDGDVFSWGYGKTGALGHGLNEHEENFESLDMPMEVLSLKNRGTVKISCGDMHTAVVLLSGKLLTCGWSDQGRLGRPSREEFSSCLVPVALKSHLCTYVSCGGGHTLALTESKDVIAFGSNGHGQLGLGDRRDRVQPTKIRYFDDPDLVVTSIAAGKLHSFAISHDARLFAWGSDELGQCGVGAYPQIYTVPHLVPSSIGLHVNQISGGLGHSVALTMVSHKHLDALESNQPTRYANLIERYEFFVEEDIQRRKVVLAETKRQRLEKEAAARARSPRLEPTDIQSKPEASLSSLEKQLQKVMAADTVSVGGCQKQRPRTAMASGRSGQSKSNHSVRSPPSPRRLASSAPANQIWCSQLSLWRQSRLRVLQPSAKACFERPVSAKGLQSRQATILERPAFSASRNRGQRVVLGKDPSQRFTFIAPPLACASTPQVSIGFRASRPKSAPYR